MKLFGKPVGLVILDFDGVVLDLMAKYWTILAATAETMHLPLEPIQQYREGHYNGTRKGSSRFSVVVRECWPHLSEEEAIAYYWRFRAEEERIGYSVVPGSVAAIGQLREYGVPVTVCTMNDERAMAWKLASAGMKPGMVDLIITRESAGYEKPDPRILDPAFQRFGVPAAAMWYVGDWYADIEVARDAGAEFIAVLSGGIPRHAFIREGVADDHIIGSLADLSQLIEP